MAQAVLTGLCSFSEVTHRPSKPAVIALRRLVRRDGSWVYRYTTVLDDRLRAMVRDEEASETERSWALGVLHSWGIVLDPKLYPFTRRQAARQQRRGA